MKLNRRRFITASLALLSAESFAVEMDIKRTRLILLGTKGGPRVGTTAKNPSTLVIVNGVPYVVDCGNGVSQQLVAAGVPLNRLRYLLITHLHSDHMLEFGPLIYNSWAAGQLGRIDAYGPPGTTKMLKDFFEYIKFDIDTRIDDEGRPDLRKQATAHDFDKSGLVLQNDDVKITSFQVRHPPITQSYAYRFDAKDTSIVISGDTTYAPELADFAKGADVLVHEIMHLGGVDMLIKRNPNAATLRSHLLASHTVPEDVGKIAGAAGVKTLVLSHFVPGDDPNITDEMWTEGVRKYYSGRVIVGRDLLNVPLGN